MTPSFLAIYFCGSEHCTPGHAYGPAVRPHYLLHVILEGLGRYQYKGETYALQAGDAFLISPAEVTYYQADETNPWSYAWVGFDGQAVPEILSRTVFSVSCIFQNPHPDTLPSLAACMEQLLKTFLSSPEQTLASAGLLLQLFSFMQAPVREVSEKPSQSYFKKAKEYLELRSTITAAIDSGLVGFVIGEKSIENDWDAYVQNFYDLGLKRYTEIVQKYLDSLQ